MKLLLDTDICIYAINRRVPGPLERLRSYALGDAGISAPPSNCQTWARLYRWSVNFTSFRRQKMVAEYSAMFGCSRGFRETITQRRSFG